MVFKTEAEIYSSLKTKFETLLGWVPGRIAQAILKAAAAAIRILYVALEFVYWNIFATYADLAALRRMYEDWDVAWDSPTLDTARRTIFNRYRQKSVGTVQWFETSVLLNWEESAVTTADAKMNSRGINTLDILVTNRGGPVAADVLDGMQTFFDSEANKICNIDVLVMTV